MTERDPARRFPGRRRAARGLAVAGVLAALVAAAAPAGAQISATNQVEARAGYNPFRLDLPKNGTSLYDLLQLGYQLEGASFGLRFEGNQKSQEDLVGAGYQRVTQRWAEWNDDHLRVRAGNFYTILGRGLIHRSFELQGVILQDDEFAARYAPSRDVDGVLAEGTVGPVNARAFSGRASNGTHSPAADDDDNPFNDTHPGVISGGQVAARLYADSKLGAAYVRTAEEREYASGFVELDLPRILGFDLVQAPIYAEYARAQSSWNDWWRFDTGEPGTALYTGANLLVGPAALSAEWKDYRGFELGTNDPPSLVPEHSFRLLNRNTHFLLARREEGYQLEGSYGLPAWGSLTFNLSRSDGDIGSRSFPRPVRFEERYTELHITPSAFPMWEGTLFWQRGKDEFVSIFDRSVVGASGTLRFLDRWSVTGDVEGLEANHAGCYALREDYGDRYASVSLARADWGSVALQWERTTDCLDEDPGDQTNLVVDPNTFVAGTVSAQLSDRHGVSLFVGERRGGLACTAGTCYIVQPFKGAELRVVSRF